MIVETILKVFMGLVKMIISLFPAIKVSGIDGKDFNNLLSIAFFFFPPDVWAVIVSNIAFWWGVTLAWSIVEWCYKKIPGVT